MSKRDEMVEMSGDPDLLFMDGFDDCIIGLTTGCDGNSVVAYDGDKVVESLMGMGMTNEDAEEYYSFNIECCYVGKYTPILIRK